MKNAFIVALAGMFILTAQSVPASARKPQLIEGAEAQQRVNHLTKELQWFHSLPQAQATAQKQGKMIFWVQMLGDMAGAT